MKGWIFGTLEQNRKYTDKIKMHIINAYHKCPDLWNIGTNGEIQVPHFHEKFPRTLFFFEFHLLTFGHSTYRCGNYSRQKLFAQIRYVSIDF